jgi:hypothetical protein
MTVAYPLTWPSNIPRQKVREKGQFKTALSGALANVKNSMNLFGRDSGKAISNLVISSNVTLGENRPADPGVAIWFTWDGLQVCIPVDRYQTVEANLQAIHHIIEARRVELRHGTLALVRATFTGFLALPPAGDRKRPWREILGFNADKPGVITKDRIEGAYRLMAKTCHPDTATGSHEAMAELNRARDEALREIG